MRNIFTTFLNKDGAGKILSGVIAAALLGGSSVAFYVSRLATYDMPSFYFFLLGLITLLKAERINENHGKWYFLSVLFLFLAFMTKIVIAIYLPFVISYSFLQARKNPNLYYFWIRYFLLPLCLGIGIYSLVNFSNLISYFSSQNAREKSDYLTILKTYLDNSLLIWPLWLVGSIGLILNKDWKKWIYLTAFSFIILLFHLATHRWPTLDKHIFLSLLFIIPMTAIGISNLLSSVFVYPLKTVLITVIIYLIMTYWFASFIEAQKYNRQWHNSNSMLSFLGRNTRPGDKVLAEVGAGAILTNYDLNYPPYTVTFDWFKYGTLQGEDAYLAAIKDGYFDMIQLDGGDATSQLIHSTMHNLVRKNLGGNYKLVYSQDDYLIYARAF